MIGDQIGLFDLPTSGEAPPKAAPAPKRVPAPAPLVAVTTIVECVPTPATQAAIAEGYARFEVNTKAHGPSDEWDKAVIDQVIRAFARQGDDFSANDFRDLLPPVRSCLISRRLIVAQHDGIIEWTRTTTPSSLKSTNAAGVKVYRPTAAASTAPLTREVAA